MKLDQFSANERRLIARIEAAGAELDSDPRGWGFFHASDEALALIKELPGVQFLDLFEACEASDVSDNGLVHAGEMNTLICLRLGPGISDLGLAHLPGLTSLKELRLDSAGEDVSDEGLKHVGQLIGLEELSLQYTGITDAGLRHLAALARLADLTLDGTEITDEGLKHLRRLKALRKLSLHDTSVTKQGVSSLAESLPDCKTSGAGSHPRSAKTREGASKKDGRAAPVVGAVAPKFHVHSILKGGHASETVADAAFSPDGMFLASTSMSRAIVWDLATGTKLRSLKCPKRAMGKVAYAPDGVTIFAISMGDGVRRWDAATGQEHPPIRSETQWNVSLAIRPDGAMLAASGSEGQVFLWELPSGREVGVLQVAERKRAVNSLKLAFHPDGSKLAVCGWNIDASIYEVSSGRQVQRMRGHEGELGKIGINVLNVSFSPDGSLLASAGGDGTVRLWDAATGQQRAVLKGHLGPVYGLAFHPAGATLASGGGLDREPAGKEEQDIRLWDVATAKQGAVTATGAKSQSVMSFSADGKMLVTNGKGGTLLLFEVP